MCFFPSLYSRFPVVTRIVLFGSQLLNIADVQIWAASLNRQPSVDSDDGRTDRASIKSILCMPILNGKKDVIGVAQLINKVNDVPRNGIPEKPNGGRRFVRINNDDMLSLFVIYVCDQDTGSPFTDCDVATFEAFAIFCGLGIHNTQMYESACEYDDGGHETRIAVSDGSYVCWGPIRLRCNETVVFRKRCFKIVILMNYSNILKRGARLSFE